MTAVSKINEVTTACTITEIPFPLTGLFPHEQGFTEHSLNANIRLQIQKVQEYLRVSPSFHDRAEEYINAMMGRVEQNAFLLGKRINENPSFSASLCVRMKDIEGLKLIVANGWGDVNAQDSRGRAAIHFAATQDDAEFVRVLLLHEKIDLSLKTLRQNLPIDVARSQEVIELLS